MVTIHTELKDAKLVDPSTNEILFLSNLSLMFLKPMAIAIYRRIIFLCCGCRFLPPTLDPNLHNYISVIIQAFPRLQIIINLNPHCVLWRYEIQQPWEVDFVFTPNVIYTASLCNASLQRQYSCYHYIRQKLSLFHRSVRSLARNKDWTQNVWVQLYTIRLCFRS